MTPASISSTGVVKNIKGLNYTYETVVREYLNNVLDKNTHPDHTIRFIMKDIPFKPFMFECTEENACGFSDLNELWRAFNIAYSDRSGTNNMGYGIFSPITLNKGHDAYNLFLQSNERGNFYATVYFNAEESTLWTHSGEVEDGCILGRDVSHLLVEGGTRTIWITFPNVCVTGEPHDYGVDYVVKKVSQQYKASLNIPVNAEIGEEVARVGTYYVDYLSDSLHPRNIFYGDTRIQPENFLLKDDGSSAVPYTYDIDIAQIDGRVEFQIKDTEGVWKILTLSSTEPVGRTGATRRSGRSRVTQSAKLKVYDIGTPGSTLREAMDKRKSYRKIWVKIGHTYIFAEDLQMNGWPNCRVVLELENTEDNHFNEFISPDPNKSNSKINTALKARLTPLIKMTLNSKFKTNPPVKVSLTDKHKVWLRVMDNVCKGPCTSANCVNEMTAWKYEITRLNPDLGTTVQNLTPICKACHRD